MANCYDLINESEFEVLVVYSNSAITTEMLVISVGSKSYVDVCSDTEPVVLTPNSSVAIVPNDECSNGVCNPYVLTATTGCTDVFLGGCITGYCYNHYDAWFNGLPVITPSYQQLIPRNSNLWSVISGPQQPGLIIPPFSYPNFTLSCQDFLCGFPGLDSTTPRTGAGYPAGTYLPNGFFDFFQIQFEGYINLIGGQSYQFRLCSDDGAEFTIYSIGSTFGTNNGITAPTGGSVLLQIGDVNQYNCIGGCGDPIRYGTITVPTTGWYPFTLDYYQGPRYQMQLQLQWDVNGTWVDVPESAFQHPGCQTIMPTPTPNLTPTLTPTSTGPATTPTPINYDCVPKSLGGCITGYTYNHYDLGQLPVLFQRNSVAWNLSYGPQIPGIIYGPFLYSNFDISCQYFCSFPGLPDTFVRSGPSFNIMFFLNGFYDYYQIQFEGFIYLTSGTYQFRVCAIDDVLFRIYDLTAVFGTNGGTTDPTGGALLFQIGGISQTINGQNDCTLGCTNLNNTGTFVCNTTGWYPFTLDNYRGYARLFNLLLTLEWNTPLMAPGTWQIIPESAFQHPGCQITTTTTQPTTPTPTPTSSKLPNAGRTCACQTFSWQWISTTYPFATITYVDCNGISQNISVSENESQTLCSRIVPNFSFLGGNINNRVRITRGDCCCTCYTLIPLPSISNRNATFVDCKTGYRRTLNNINTSTRICSSVIPTVRYAIAVPNGDCEFNVTDYICPNSPTPTPTPTRTKTPTPTRTSTPTPTRTNTPTPTRTQSTPIATPTRTQSTPITTPTLTSTPTLTRTPQNPICIAECDVLFLSNNDTLISYNVNTHVFNNYYFPYSAADIAHTNNRIWINRLNQIDEFIITLCPFTYTLNRTITLQSSTGGGLCYKNPNTLISTVRISNVEWIAEINILTTSITPLFQTYNNLRISGDMVLINGGTQIACTYISNSSTEYLVIHNYPSGLVSNVIIAPLSSWGLFTFNNNLYLQTSFGDIYNVNINTGQYTIVDTSNSVIYGASNWLTSCIPVPTPTPTPTKTPTPTPTPTPTKTPYPCTVFISQFQSNTTPGSISLYDPTTNTETPFTLPGGRRVGNGDIANALDPFGVGVLWIRVGNTFDEYYYTLNPFTITYNNTFTTGINTVSLVPPIFGDGLCADNFATLIGVDTVTNTVGTFNNFNGSNYTPLFTIPPVPPGYFGTREVTDILSTNLGIVCLYSDLNNAGGQFITLHSRTGQIITDFFSGGFLLGGLFMSNNQLFGYGGTFAIGGNPAQQKVFLIDLNLQTITPFNTLTSPIIGNYLTFGASSDPLCNVFLPPPPSPTPTKTSTPTPTPTPSSPLTVGTNCACQTFYFSTNQPTNQFTKIRYVDCNGVNKNVFVNTIQTSSVCSQISPKFYYGNTNITNRYTITLGECCCTCYDIKPGRTGSGRVNFVDCKTGNAKSLVVNTSTKICSSVIPTTISATAFSIGNCRFDGLIKDWFCRVTTPTPTSTPTLTPTYTPNPFNCDCVRFTWNLSNISNPRFSYIGCQGTSINLSPITLGLSGQIYLCVAHLTFPTHLGGPFSVGDTWNFLLVSSLSCNQNAGCGVTPTPTPTPTRTSTPTPTPTLTSTLTPTPTPTETLLCECVEFNPDFGQADIEYHDCIDSILIFETIYALTTKCINTRLAYRIITGTANVTAPCYYDNNLKDYLCGNLYTPTPTPTLTPTPSTLPILCFTGCSFNFFINYNNGSLFLHDFGLNILTDVTLYYPPISTAVDIAYDGTNLWIITENGTIYEHNVTLCPFSITISRVIFSPPSITGYRNSLCNTLGSNTILITDNGTNILVIDITNSPYTLTIPLGGPISLPANRNVSGDILLTPNNELFVNTTDTLSFTKYITVYDYTTSTLILDINIGTTDTTGGLFMFLGNVFVSSSNGIVYQINTSGTGSITNVLNITLPFLTTINGAASDLNCNVPPFPTPTPTATTIQPTTTTTTVCNCYELTFTGNTGGCLKIGVDCSTGSNNYIQVNAGQTVYGCSTVEPYNHPMFGCSNEVTITLVGPCTNNQCPQITTTPTPTPTPTSTQSFLNCPCTQAVNPPSTVNGITITDTYSGDVTVYTGPNISCGGAIVNPSGAKWLGQFGNTFTYTLNFSVPVNDVVIVLGGCGGGVNENFIITTDTGNGIPTITSNCSCYSTINGNEILSGAGSPGLNNAGGGQFTITNSVDYNSITVTGNGGQSGSVISVCVLTPCPSQMPDCTILLVDGTGRNILVYDLPSNTQTRYTVPAPSTRNLILEIANSTTKLWAYGGCISGIACYIDEYAITLSPFTISFVRTLTFTSVNTNLSQTGLCLKNIISSNEAILLTQRNETQSYCPIVEINTRTLSVTPIFNAPIINGVPGLLDDILYTVNGNIICVYRGFPSNAYSSIIIEHDYSGNVLRQLSAPPNIQISGLFVHQCNLYGYGTNVFAALNTNIYLIDFNSQSVTFNLVLNVSTSVFFFGNMGASNDPSCNAI